MNDSTSPSDRTPDPESVVPTPENTVPSEDTPTPDPVEATTESGQGRPPRSPKSAGAPPSGSDDDPDLEETELGGRMTFLEHLDELRRRILFSIVAIAGTFVVAWIFHAAIFRFLEEPILGVVDRLVVIKPTDPFTIYLKVSFTAAIFLAIPFILFQVWLFVAPGLYRKEKRYVLPFLLSSTVLFVLGGMFAYYIVLPPALDFLLNQFGKEFQAMITAMDYFDFELLIILGMGAVFQLPVLVAFLSIFGLVTPRFLWKNFRYAFLIITIVAAVVSPTTDPFNLFLWSGPMVILYIVSIAVAWIFKRRRDQRKAAAD